MLTILDKKIGKMIKRWRISAQTQRLEKENLKKKNYNI